MELQDKEYRAKIEKMRKQIIEIIDNAVPMNRIYEQGNKLEFYDGQLYLFVKYQCPCGHEQQITFYFSEKEAFQLYNEMEKHFKSKDSSTTKMESHTDKYDDMSSLDLIRSMSPATFNGIHRVYAEEVIAEKRQAIKKIIKDLNIEDEGLLAEAEKLFPGITKSEYLAEKRF